MQPGWARLPSESAKAFQAFEVYRALGAERSLETVARRLSKSVQLMKRWSRRWGWVERARWWDNHEAQQWAAAAVEAHRQAIARMGESHASQTEAAIEALMAPIREILDRIRVASDRRGAAFTDLSMAELVQLGVRATSYLPRLQEAERLARGMPGHVVEVEGSTEDDVAEAAILADPTTARKWEEFRVAVAAWSSRSKGAA